MRFYNLINQLTSKAIAIVLFCLLSFSSFSTQAGDDPNWALTQKAKIIRYLLSTVIWPNEVIKNDVLNVCILGELPSGKPVKELNGSKIGKYSIKVKQTSLKQQNQDCQLIYVTASQNGNAKEIITTYAGKPILLVSDMNNFADQGGSMNFIETKGIIALTVNIESVKKSNLKFDMNVFNHITVIPKQIDLDE